MGGCLFGVEIECAWDWGRVRAIWVVCACFCGGCLLTFVCGFVDVCNFVGWMLISLCLL